MFIYMIILNFLTIIEMILMPILIKIQNLLKIFYHGGEIAAKDSPKLQLMARDILAMQASLVASEGVFSAENFQLGEHMHSLAADSLEISVLFWDCINIARRNLAREPLPTKFQVTLTK